ncbi:MAG: hypothetical protein AAGA20_01945 [Planctomycetota bacterium]
MSLPEPYESPSLPHKPPAGRERLTLEEVLAQGTGALEQVMDGLFERTVDFDSLEAAIRATRTGLVDRSGTGSSDEGDGIDVAELAEAIQILEEFSGKGPIELSVVHPMEEASILVHEMLFRAAFVDVRLVRRLDAALAEVKPDERRDFLWGVVTDAAELCSFERLDAVLPRIAPALRRAFYPLSEAYAELASQGSAQGREALWPHILDELFVSMKGRRSKLDEILMSLDAEAYERAVVRLASLPSIVDGRISPASFEIDQPFFRHLFWRLIDTPAQLVVGPVVMAAFHRSPPADPGVRSLLYAMRQYHEALAPILREQLAAQKGLVSVECEERIAELLLWVFDTLPPERMDEIWISHAIDWLGLRDWSNSPHHLHEQTGELLVRITQERKGLGRSWDSECRSAAKRALRDGGWIE